MGMVVIGLRGCMHSMCGQFSWKGEPEYDECLDEVTGTGVMNAQTVVQYRAVVSGMRAVD